MKKTTDLTSEQLDALDRVWDRGFNAGVEAERMQRIFREPWCVVDKAQYKSWWKKSEVNYD